MAFEIQDKALMTTGLDPIEKLVLIALAHFANKDTWECWPSQKKISEIVGRSEKQVNRLINSLCDKHLIVQSGRHGPTLKYKIFPADEDLEKALGDREKRKQKYHAAAVARGEKIKKENEEKRKAKAAEHPMDGMSEHPMDGMSGYPMDGIQTNKENQEENLISNQEENKENNIEESIIKQDNSNRNILEEQPIEEEPIQENVLSVVNKRTSSSDSFSEDDARDVFELMDYPFPEAGEVALMQKAGCKLWQKLSIKELPTKTEVKLRLVKTYDEASSVIHDAESNNFQGIKNLDGWKVGTLVHKADEYNGKTLTAEEALRIVIAYYQQLYPEWKELVEKAVTAECSQRTKLEEAAANGWNGISKAIQWAKGIYKVRLDVIIRINNGEEVPQEEVVRSF